MRLPASRASRILASAGRVILLVSKRSCAAVETLLTFWPPGPEARTNEISMSSSLIVRSREIRSMASPEKESARRIAGLPFTCSAASVPFPLAGEGQGAGSKQTVCVWYPTPNPSPQGGGEPTHLARGREWRERASIRLWRRDDRCPHGCLRLAADHDCNQPFAPQPLGGGLGIIERHRIDNAVALLE